MNTPSLTKEKCKCSHDSSIAKKNSVLFMELDDAGDRREDQRKGEGEGEDFSMM